MLGINFIRCICFVSSPGSSNVILLGLGWKHAWHSLNQCSLCVHSHVTHLYPKTGSLRSDARFTWMQYLLDQVKQCHSCRSTCADPSLTKASSTRQLHEAVSLVLNFSQSRLSAAQASSETLCTCRAIAAYLRTLPNLCFLDTYKRMAQDFHSVSGPNHKDILIMELLFSFSGWNLNGL